MLGLQMHIFIYFYNFVFGPHLAVLRIYFYFHALGSFLVGSGDHSPGLYKTGDVLLFPKPCDNYQALSVCFKIMFLNNTLAQNGCLFGSPDCLATRRNMGQWVG